MRELLCAVVLVLIIHAPLAVSGQQTDVRYAISNASIGMTAASLETAGLPSYSQLVVTDESAVTARADACPAGAFSLDDALICTLCPAGKYSPQGTATGPDTCVSCESGKYSLAAGASSSSTCTDCQNGTYSTTVGASLAATCLSCPANSTSYAGARLLQACVCVPGHEGPNGAACSPCNASVWCLNGMANPCPPNSMSSPMSSSLAQCLCVASYYGDTTVGSAELVLCQVLEKRITKSSCPCSVSPSFFLTRVLLVSQECRAGSYCPGGMANFTLVCPNGTYSLAGSDDIFDCICPEHADSKRSSRNVMECVCQAGFHREYSNQFPPANWWCKPCVPGEYCWENRNLTCPSHAFSFGSAKSYTDCFCNPAWKNATNRTEQNYCDECPANSYCTGQGAVESCVPNAIAPVQSASYTACTCGLGWKGVNNTPCVACQSPTFCYGGLEATCPEGTFSPPLAWDRLNCSCLAGMHVSLNVCN